MLAAPFFGFLAGGIWQDRRGSNLLDSGSPFYDTYVCADGRHVAVACLEPQFFAEFCRLLPLEERFAAAQYDETLWLDMRAAIATRIMQKPRDEWAALFEETDACVAPVLSFGEAPAHPHNLARGTHVTRRGFTRPSPAPRFSRTQGTVSEEAHRDHAVTLAAFGLAGDEIEHLVSQGLVGK